MNDIVTKLRKFAAIQPEGNGPSQLAEQAAAEIEMLRGFFWEFGTHQDECEVNYRNNCDCGWDIAAATLPDEVT